MFKLNSLKTMLDHYFCTNSMMYSAKLKKRMALYFVAVSQLRSGWTLSLIFAFQIQVIYILFFLGRLIFILSPNHIRAKNVSDVVKWSGPE